MASSSVSPSLQKSAVRMLGVTSMYTLDEGRRIRFSIPLIGGIETQVDTMTPIQAT